MNTLEARALEGPLSAACNHARRHRGLRSRIGQPELAKMRKNTANRFVGCAKNLTRYAADHPDYGLIKTLLSGSLAKGTALKALNDIDVAFYVKAEKTPSAEPDLLNWLAQRLREAYPQMKPDQIKPNSHSVCIKYAVSGSERRCRAGPVQR